MRSAPHPCCDSHSDLLAPAILQDTRRYQTAASAQTTAVHTALFLEGSFILESMETLERSNTLGLPGIRLSKKVRQACDAPAKQFVAFEFPASLQPVYARNASCTRLCNSASRGEDVHGRKSVPNENSVQPMAHVIPLDRTAKLKQSALVESDERNSAMRAVQGRTV